VGDRRPDLDPGVAGRGLLHLLEDKPVGLRLGDRRPLGNRSQLARRVADPNHERQVPLDQHTDDTSLPKLHRQSDADRSATHDYNVIRAQHH